MVTRLIAKLLQNRSLSYNFPFLSEEMKYKSSITLLTCDVLVHELKLNSTSESM
jgi:hypothetical protein